jgi:hypothetical protein
MRGRALTALLVFAAGLVATLLAELAVRKFVAPPPFADFILAYPGDVPKFQLDRELGYFPRVGDMKTQTGYAYDLHGINVDQSLRLDTGKPRILFLGDSVVRQAKILRALDAAYAGNHWQFLNSGVEGYNIPQEVAYFRRFSSIENPDRILLTIHNNDLTYFPMTYMSGDEEFFWYFPGEFPLRIYRRLYRASFLYRHFATWQYLQLQHKVQTEHALPARTRAALAELRDWAKEHHVRLQALVLPILQPMEKWTLEEKDSRRDALAITKELGIETYDLLPPLEQALRTGKRLTVGLDEDTWHPNDLMAGYFARYLKEQGLFADLPLDSVAVSAPVSEKARKKR